MTTVMTKPEMTQEQETKETTPFPVIRSPRVRINRTLRQKDLQTIYDERAQYHKPKYQRHKVYSYVDEQMIFLSIVVGIPLDPLQCEIGLDPDTNAYVKFIMNGWQRFNTYIRIMEDKVRLPSAEAMNKYLPNSPILKEVKYLAGLTFHRLGEEYQQDIREFDTWVVIMGNIPPGWQPDIFALVNRHHNLSVGDRLASRMSETSRIAEELCNWEQVDFWSQCWRLSRNQVIDISRVRFTSVIEMLMLESAQSPWYIPLREEQMMPWTSGLYDTLLTEEFLERVHYRMHCMGNAFAGVGTSTKTDIICMYQACLLLEEQGFNLEYSEEGCLTKWLLQTKKSQRFSSASTYNIVAHLRNVEDQKKFWDIYLRWLCTHIPGLVKQEQVTEQFLAERATSGRM